jgi:hypothetical protein
LEKDWFGFLFFNIKKKRQPYYFIFYNFMHKQPFLVQRRNCIEGWLWALHKQFTALEKTQTPTETPA